MGEYSRPEFEILKYLEWECTEKIDGTNIRVMFNVNPDLRYSTSGESGQVLSFGGKTDRAQIPAPLVNRLNEIFSVEKMLEVFENTNSVCLYGEGYGNKIQNPVGKKYIPDGVDFILFDVLIGGPDGHQIWLERENIEKIAESLGINAVPLFGHLSLTEAVYNVKLGFRSKLADVTAEGLIMKPVGGFLDRQGRRIITKIKHKDFENG